MEGPAGPAVVRVWRYPVKSLGGEHVAASRADERGLAGDRTWAIQDGDGRLGSGKTTSRFRRIPGLLGLSARYLGDPATEAAAAVVIGPDGRAHPVASGDAEAFLRRFTGLPGIVLREDPGISHFDEVPLTLVGTATLDWLAGRLPGVPADARRLRPNLVIATAEPFTEESWLGRPVSIGAGPDAVRVVFDRVLERCAMVGMRQPGLPESALVLKRIAGRPDRPLCLAIGGRVTRGGVIRVGDPVRPAPG